MVSQVSIKSEKIKSENNKKAKSFKKKRNKKQYSFKVNKLNKNESKIDEDLKNESLRRIDERNKRTLYVRFPNDLKVSSHDEMKKLIPNALCYRVPDYCNRHFYFKFVYAEFNSESDALQEMEKLLSNSLSVERMTADAFCNDTINPYKLFVSGIPKEEPDDHLGSIFPNAEVNRNNGSKFRNNADFRTIAHLKYKTVEEARDAFIKGKDLRILAQPILVLFRPSENNKQKGKIISKNSEPKTELKNIE